MKRLQKGLGLALLLDVMERRATNIRQHVILAYSPVVRMHTVNFPWPLEEKRLELGYIVHVMERREATKILQQLFKLY